MAQTGEVDVASIRTAMNEVDTTEFANSVIDQKLTEAEAIVSTSLTADALADLDQTLYNIAVRGVAAWRVWMTTPAEIKKAALELTITYDVQTYTNRLRDQRDAALARIGLGSGGVSAPIADHTDGVEDATGGGAG